MKIVYNNKSFSFVLLFALIILLLLFERNKKMCFLLLFTFASFVRSFVLVPYYVHVCEYFCSFRFLFFQCATTYDECEMRRKRIHIVLKRFISFCIALCAVMVVVVVYLVVCDHRERHIERRCLQFLFAAFCCFTVALAFQCLSSSFFLLFNTPCVCNVNLLRCDASNSILF